MSPKARLSAELGARLAARLKFAKLLSMSDEELAREARRLEDDPLFARLKRDGALRVEAFSKAYFRARRFAGRSLAVRASDVGPLLDAGSELVRLLKKVGPDRLRSVFLEGSGLTDEARGRRCGVSAADARRLREFLDRVYIQEEFETPAVAAPAKVYSAVAGFEVSNGGPSLAFFHREVWKGRYLFDAERLGACLERLAPESRDRARRLVKRLELVDRRKTTLYRALEALAHAQKEYLESGEPSRRQPLTQRALAHALGVESSALHRLIANKSVELPWGAEAPLKSLLPSAKRVALDRFEALAREQPELTDEGLREELARAHRIYLSRRSIAQYRKDLGLGASGRRSP